MSTSLPEFYVVQLGSVPNPTTPESFIYSETCMPDIWARLAMLEEKVAELEIKLSAPPS